MSRCDALRDDLRYMSGNEAETGYTGPVPGGGSVRHTRSADDLAGKTIWLCPAVVSLSAAEIAAALYAFSDLIDDVPQPTCAVVRGELSFVIARFGTAMIERAAESIAGNRKDRLLDLLTAFSARIDRSPSADRLDWCRRQADLILGADDA
jgi:hypothetical protein